MPNHSLPIDAERCTAQTSSGARCKRFVTPGETMCAGHLGSPGGRPSKLDPTVVARLLGVLRVGGYPEAAAGVAGIHRSTLNRWIARGDPEGTDPEDAPYRAFVLDLAQARAEGETRNVAIIAQAASQNWQAAAWMLERSYPERWARVSQRGDIPGTSPAPADKADPFAEVDELAQRRKVAPE